MMTDISILIQGHGGVSLESVELIISNRAVDHGADLSAVARRSSVVVGSWYPVTMPRSLAPSCISL